MNETNEPKLIYSKISQVMSAEIPLQNGGVTIVSQEDIAHLSQWEWRKSSLGYVERWDATGDKRKRVHMHRVVNQTPPGMDTDHINRDPLDNRRDNLRTATRNLNNRNRGCNRNNTSGIVGVTWDKNRKKWAAACCINYKYRLIGRYETKEQAADAREAFLKENFND